jgi:hypothetical protein
LLLRRGLKSFCFDGGRRKAIDFNSKTNADAVLLFSSFNSSAAAQSPIFSTFKLKPLRRVELRAISGRCM